MPDPFLKYNGTSLLLRSSALAKIIVNPTFCGGWGGLLKLSVSKCRTSLQIPTLQVEVLYQRGAF